MLCESFGSVLQDLNALVYIKHSLCLHCVDSATCEVRVFSYLRMCRVYGHEEEFLLSKRSCVESIQCFVLN